MTIVSSYSKTVGQLSGPGPYNQLSSTRQKRPFVNGAFSSSKIYPAAVLRTGHSAKQRVFTYLEHNAPPDSLRNDARAAAYSRLMGKALPKAAMLVNMAQFGQTWGMIASRSLQLVRAFRYLRRGQLDSFAAELFLSPPDVKKKITPKRAKQDASGAWLEFTFGWSPFIADIYNAVDVLQTDFPVDPVNGSARVSGAFHHFDGYVHNYTDKTVRARCTAKLQVTNPNLLLANQLGLLNPAAVVWDIIPFSFMVDWFLPVGKFISTFNDQAGINLLGQCTTSKLLVDNKLLYPGVGESSAYGTRTIREPGAFVKPGFPTKFKLPTPSLWLAATNVSLAIQVFGGKK